MGTLAIVEAFDVIKDLGAGLGRGLKNLAIEQLQSERAPDAFHGRILITIPTTAHRSDQAGVTERLTIFTTTVLDSTVGVEQQVGGRAAMQKGHAQSF